MAFDRRFLNVIILGFAFMFVFTAFQTMGNIEKTILDSIHQDDDSFEGDGYTSLAVIYAVFALCNWLAPSIISVSGPRIAMLIGAITYCLFIASFLLPKTWLLYLASCVMGFGAAIIWTGQGNYLTLNSDSLTISRNSGIFWAMLQASMFFGNLFVYFQFQGKTHIDAHTRLSVFIVLLIIAAVGIVFLLILRPAQSPDGEMVQKEEGGPLNALRRAFALLITKEMILLSVTFFYTGIELSFFSGVYSPSIGFTKQMGSNVKQLVGLSGIFIGVGEVLGGALFGILGSKTIRWGRDPIVMFGFLIHVISFFLIFLNLPNAAPFGDTDEAAFINSNAYVAILCSLLLGFGDSCYNTQIYSILGGVFPEDSAPAFALFKFTQSVAAAASFFYSSHIGLHAQLGILVLLGTFGTISFCFVEWAARSKKAKGYNGAIDDSDLMGGTVISKHE
ncbi:UNC93-like protein MFSD11 [Cryptotermes secundus]|uniref:UNC93-like protein MFSD11 n=1 Tax=Cryptotermes secundus TaxID=105785 RepID=A0A2J7QD95_9NEOP|nr:UNC93-like protein MFSD11 [Cryptotermes secundus]PNF26549.1 UNC93-like protein MFSD11 [Cryptotermes secundus]